MNIIATAQPIGFGPVSNLVTLVKDLNKDIDYFGFGTCFEFLAEIGHKPILIRKEKEFEDTLKALTNKKYDLLISVMGSKSAILAKKLGIPILYLDLVFWMWEDLNSIDFYKKKALDIEKSSLEDIKKNYFFEEGKNDELRKETSVLSHFISDKSLVQEFIPCEGLNKKIILSLEHSEQTLPLMNDNIFHLSKEKKEKDLLFFSLGGMQVQNDYRFVMRDLLSLLQIDHRLVVIGSKEHLYPVPSNLLQTTEYLNKVSEYPYVFAQPGFSTIYELMYMNIIPIILPAQNIGQLKFVHFLKQFLDKNQFIEWEDIYQYKDEQLIEYVAKVNTYMNKDKDLPRKLNKKLHQTKKYVEKNMTTILEKQQRFLQEQESILPSAKLLLEDFICFINNKVNI